MAGRSRWFVGCTNTHAQRCQQPQDGQQIQVVCGLQRHTHPATSAAQSLTERRRQLCSRASARVSCTIAVPGPDFRGRAPSPGTCAACTHAAQRAAGVVGRASSSRSSSGSRNRACANATLMRQPPVPRPLHGNDTITLHFQNCSTVTKIVPATCTACTSLVLRRCDFHWPRCAQSSEVRPSRQAESALHNETGQSGTQWRKTASRQRPPDSCDNGAACRSGPRPSPARIAAAFATAAPGSATASRAKASSSSAAAAVAAPEASSASTGANSVASASFACLVDDG